MYSAGMGLMTQQFNFRVGRILIMAIIVLAMMSFTHPGRVPALMLVVPFMALFMLGYFIMLEVIRLFAPDDSTAGGMLRVHRPRLLAALSAGYPVLLLVLQSIMELNRWDVMIASAIFILAYLVVSRGAYTIRG